MSDPENITIQESIKHEFENWQKQYYDDVYSLFEKRDEQRLAIAFNHWEDGFLIFLHDKFPRLAKVYKIQVASLMPPTTGGSVENFKSYTSNPIEVFLAQCIEDAKKGDLNQHYVASNKATKAAQVSPEKKISTLMTFVFVVIPKTIGRLFFDLFGQGDKVALSSTIIVGYIAIIVVALLLLRVLSPNILVNLYRFFYPEPK